jgi:ribose transport system substrate-binding protein
MRSPRRARLAAAFLAVFVAVGLTAGATSASTKKGAAPKAAIKLGYISLGEQIPFVALVTKGLQKAAKANGAELLVCDSQIDAQKAINCAAQFKTQGVQGIANFQLDATAAPRVCAAGPKVPVVAIDIHQSPCETVFYGADNFNAGKLAGSALGKFAKDKWNCQVDGLLSVNAPTAGKVVVLRENGAIAGVKAACPGVKVIKVVSKATTDSTIQPFTDTLARLPGKTHLLVTATNDDQTIGAIKAAQAVGRLGDIYTGSQGADPTSWPYMCGKTPFKNWVADVAYFPERYGDTVIPLLLSLIDGQSKPKQVFVNHRVVTPENLKTIYPTACK